MIKSLLLPVSFLFLLASCTSLEMANIEPKVTLPASQNCYAVEVLTKKERIIPKAECDEIKKRAIFITSEDWKKLRGTNQKNCIRSRKCVEIRGAFDSLFMVIDEGFRQLP